MKDWWICLLIRLLLGYTPIAPVDLFLVWVLPSVVAYIDPDGKIPCLELAIPPT